MAMEKMAEDMGVSPDELIICTNSAGQILLAPQPDYHRSSRNLQSLVNASCASG